MVRCHGHQAAKAVPPAIGVDTPQTPAQGVTRRTRRTLGRPCRRLRRAAARAVGPPTEGTPGRRRPGHARRLGRADRPPSPLARCQPRDVATTPLGLAAPPSGRGSPAQRHRARDRPRRAPASRRAALPGIDHGKQRSGGPGAVRGQLSAPYSCGPLRDPSGRVMALDSRDRRWKRGSTQVRFLCASAKNLAIEGGCKGLSASNFPFSLPAEPPGAWAQAPAPFPGSVPGVR
jgi:hypothetical protein